MTNPSTMIENHPITPPPELIEQWYEKADNPLEDAVQGVATRAARWGADVELEACCKVLESWGSCLSPDLRAARRPKPPSLKEQALAALSRLNSGALCANPIVDKDTIRRALEQLDD